MSSSDTLKPDPHTGTIAAAISGDATILMGILAEMIGNDGGDGEHSDKHAAMRLMVSRIGWAAAELAHMHGCRPLMRGVECWLWSDPREGIAWQAIERRAAERLAQPQVGGVV